MKRLLIVTMVLALGGGVALAQDKAQPPAQPSQEEVQAAWAKFMTPGPEHELLAKRAGTWKGKVKMWEQPNGTPTESEMESELKMIMGGRYLEEHAKGSFSGMPFEGYGVVGFDNGQKKYVMTWIDNLGTGIMVGEGTFDADKKELEIAGKMTDPMTGELCNTRSVERWTGDDSFVMEMYMPGPDGKEFKMMEITYNRVR